MPLPATSPEALAQAIATFDAELRESEAWRGWERNLNYEHAISRDGKLYPVKQIISMATGVPHDSFSGGPEANSYVTSYGLRVVPVRPEYLLLRSNIGAKWQDSPGQRYHF